MCYRQGHSRFVIFNKVCISYRTHMSSKGFITDLPYLQFRGDPYYNIEVDCEDHMEICVQCKWILRCINEFVLERNLNIHFWTVIASSCDTVIQIVTQNRNQAVWMASSTLQCCDCFNSLTVKKFKPSFMIHSPGAPSTSEVFEQIYDNQLSCVHSDTFNDIDPKLSSY